METQWVPVLGQLEFGQDGILFHGGQEQADGQSFTKVAQWITNQRLGDGKVSAKIRFDDPSDGACELVLFYDPGNQGIVSAGLGGGDAFCSLRSFGQRWAPHKVVGTRQQIVKDKTYSVEVTVIGSHVGIQIDGALISAANLPWPLPTGSAGLFCIGTHDIHISEFCVEPQQRSVFVVMQFSQPYNELYADVIAPICHEAGLRPERADENYSTGIVVSEIARQLSEAKIVIAEITPSNPNVYYEVGYAHAMGKPCILIADKESKPPFDVAPFRILFYENSIAGKKKIESGLRNYIKEILGESMGGA
jgi:hypothetical protein